ncbi:unnamed protein product [Kuraishia capsulata CBS 1993]|uniref:Nodulin-like domain-containing protein n=1 Tax=Kuraishia capsulata CBS 1993 TaxID=1382522 RepID=W6MV13_9ASCO|nr:uncharacterized protein KUCA_T00001976001 [Kuraishia capsulata CBS 1993]CDK26005.1 unnamed protein product [Kuraishia capsulata CBS 1993]
MPQSRLTVLFFSGLVALATGTPYLYGVYSPQLIQRCGLTASDSATLSFATSVGTSLASLPVGMFVDRGGPQWAVCVGAITQVFGFATLYIAYKTQLSNVPLLFFAMFCTGVGSIMAYYATLKVATANFPNHRGTAGAVPVSGYGLSALMYSTIAAYFFKDDTAGLLRFISIFCALLIGSGSLFVKIVRREEGSDDESDEEDETNPSTGATAAKQPPNHESEYGGFLAGHRGSFANINIARNDSHSSLFSYAESTFSQSSASVSSSLQAPLSPQHQVPQPIMTTTNTISSHPSFQRPSPQFSLSSSPTALRIPSGSPQQMTHSAQSTKLSTSVNSSLSSSPVISNERSSLPTRGSFVFRPAPVPVPSGSPRGSSGFMKRMQQYRTGSDSAVDEEAPLVQPESRDKSFTNYHAVRSDSSLSDLAPTAPLRLRRRRKRLTATQHIAKLLHNKVFLSNCLVMMGLSAVGQVYIYSIGFIAKALVSEERGSGAAQALQVSIISFSSFLGRLHSGPCSDLIRKRFKMQRLWVIVIALTAMTVGQGLVIFAKTTSALSVSSLLIGMAYGAAFGTFPSIMADQFGSKGFTTTWGLAGTGPIFAFLLLTKVFGHVYDHNSTTDAISGLRVCHLGRGCYADVFKLTTAICVALYFGLFALIRHNYMKEKR